MPKDASSKKKSPQGLYDRIAEVHNMAMKLNGYRASVAKYLASLDLDLNSDSKVLDAGSGTGLVSLAFHDARLGVNKSIALDLSYKSLEIAREELDRQGKGTVEPVQGNVLKLPFADDTFDLLLMCGVLEYTPLDDGLAEAARVLKKGAKLVFLPVRPSLVGSVLELIYDFKIHPLASIRDAAAKYFNVIGNHKFAISEPISWSKTIFLLEKK